MVVADVALFLRSPSLSLFSCEGPVKAFVCRASSVQALFGARPRAPGGGWWEKAPPPPPRKFPSLTSV